MESVTSDKGAPYHLERAGTPEYARMGTWIAAMAVPMPAAYWTWAFRG